MPTNLLAEVRNESESKNYTRQDLHELFEEMQRSLAPRLNSPLVSGDQVGNAVRSEKVDASIRQNFDPEKVDDKVFLDALASERKKVLLALIQGGLFLETNLESPVREQPYVKMRRLEVRDGIQLPVGYPELTAFTKFFKLRFLTF